MIYKVYEDKKLSKQADMAIEVMKSHQQLEINTIDNFDFLEENIDVKQIQSQAKFTDEEKQILIKAIQILKEKKEKIKQVETSGRQ
jgi:hypothetical protein